VPQAGSPAQTYTYSITRAASPLVSMVNMWINAAYAALHPAFNSSVHEYHSAVPYDVSTATVGFLTGYSNNVVTVNGVPATGRTSHSIPLEFGKNVTITVIAIAQDSSFNKTFTIKLYRAYAPAIHHQIMRGTLRDATCLTMDPPECHLPKYYMTGVKVNASNPIDDTHSNMTESDDFGFFEVEFLFSEMAMGKAAKLHLHWNQPGAKSNMPDGGFLMEPQIGAFSTAGHGYAYDLAASVGYLYWFPPGLKTGQIDGNVREATNNRQLNGVAVHLYEQYTGELVATKKTNWEGAFKFSGLPPSLYTISIVHSGYLDYNISHLPWVSHEVLLAISPALAGSQVRLVLEWAGYPHQGSKDMDIHMLFRPNDYVDCDVHWSWTDCGGVHLDVDNINGGQAGAETMTIEQPTSSVYTVFLDNYRGDFTVWRDRDAWGSTSPREAEIGEGEYMWPSIPRSAYDDIPAEKGWPTERSGASVRVLNKDGELASISVPSHPEDPSSEHFYRDQPLVIYDGSYRNESRYIRLLCLDFRGAAPQIFKVPQFSSSPPISMDSCVT